MRKLIVSILLAFCLTGIFIASTRAADIVRFVDTGADASGDGTTSATSSGDNTHAYQSLNAWEGAEQTDLDTANNTHTVHCNRTNSGGMDTTAVTVDGWTTSATDFITIIADDFPADGIYDSTKYVLHNNDSAVTFFSINEDFVNLTNFQMLTTGTGTNSRRGLNIVGQNVSNAINIDSCIFKGIVSGTGAGIGIRAVDADLNLTIFNTAFCDFFITGDIGFRAILVALANVANIYNCTFYNNTVGIERSGGTANVINCALFNNEDDFSGTFNTIDYCATEEGAGQGTNGVAITQTASDYAALVTDAANGDFSVKDTSSELYQTGNGATPKSVFTDDIIGTTRDAVDLNWDIGMYEFIVTAAPTGQVIIISSIPFSFRKAA